MKCILLISVCVILGCGGGQLTYMGTVAPESDPFEVTMRELATMGYAVVNADRDVGFIQAERRGSGRFPWVTRIDVLTVNIAGGEFTVIARSDEIRASGARRAWNPSSEVKADAERLRKALTAIASSGITDTSRRARSRGALP